MISSEPKLAGRSWVLVMLTFATTLIVYLVSTQRALPLEHPPNEGDGPDYENIAFNVWKGNGFGIDWDNPAWRQPYEAWNKEGIYDVILSRRGSLALTTSRPPAFPYAMAAVYSAFGRRFAPVRVLNCACLALAMALAVGLVLRIAGFGPAVIVMLTAVCDTELQAYSGTMLTESFACLGIMLFAVSFVRSQVRHDILWSVATGAALGLLVLIRSIYIFFYPLLGGLFWYTAVIDVRNGRGPRLSVGVVAFLLSALIVPLPWWVRNCIVLEHFAPLGTQGQTSLVGGYSDAAYQSGGNWELEPAVTIANQLSKEAEYQSLTPTQQEYVLAQRCFRVAVEWARE